MNKSTGDAAPKMRRITLIEHALRLLELGQPERHHSSSGEVFLPDRLGGRDEEAQGDAGPSVHGSAVWRTRAVGISGGAVTMPLVGMLDLNVRVPPRLQIVHEPILVAPLKNEDRDNNCGDENETLSIHLTQYNPQNIHGTRLTLCRSSVNPSGTIHPRADYFFPIGSVVVMK
jgi:hypothetical protein